MGIYSTTRGRARYGFGALSELTLALMRSGDLQTNDYLREVVGSSTVDVEERASAHALYGSAPKVQLPFSKFLDALEAKNDRYYLTTQSLPMDANGPTALFVSPLRE